MEETIYSFCAASGIFSKGQLGRRHEDEWKEDPKWEIRRVIFRYRKRRVGKMRANS